MAVGGRIATDGDVGLMLAVGARVKALRERRGDLSPGELAARIGVSVAYLWRIEAGRQNLSLRNLGRLAKALDVTLSELFDGVASDGATMENRPYVWRDGERDPG